MTDVWVEINADGIRGDRDGLVSLRSAINDALKAKTGISGISFAFDDQWGDERLVSIQRVGP